jgi:hypothetical protein
MSLPFFRILTMYGIVLWIRIRILIYMDTVRIHLAVLDLDPYWECGSGSKSMEFGQNLQICKPDSLPFKKAFVPSWVFF